MSDPVENQAEASSYLGMSDEEVLAQSAPVVPQEAVTEAESAEDDVAPANAPKAGVSEEVEQGDTDVADADQAEAEEVAAAPEKEVAADKHPVEEPKPKAEGDAGVNYEAEYNRLLAPFKANGRDIAVKSVDDAISLMQMGANYSKKMAALKPNLKLMKMLENNGFMSEDKIGYLIDLGKKNPDAINKLIQDSGIDPLDLSEERAKAYKQSSYTVDDRAFELDTVLDELQDTPTYTKTLDIVSNKWDVESKQAITESPQLLGVINDHVSSGIYDLISQEVERERVFGRLKGLSDIQAYRQVGDEIHARGGFNHLGSSQGKPETTKPVVVSPKPKADDNKLTDKRRAASTTKPVASNSAPKEFNPLAMTDDEISKFDINKFLQS